MLILGGYHRVVNFDHVIAMDAIDMSYGKWAVKYTCGSSKLDMTLLTSSKEKCEACLDAIVTAFHHHVDAVSIVDFREDD